MSVRFSRSAGHFGASYKALFMHQQTPVIYVYKLTHQSIEWLEEIILWMVQQFSRNSITICENKVNEKSRYSSFRGDLQLQPP